MKNSATSRIRRVVSVTAMSTVMLLASCAAAFADSSIGTVISVTGASDAIQLLAKGNATQTTNIFEVQKSDATKFFTVTNAGVATATFLTASTAASGLVLGSGANATTLSSNALSARAIAFPDLAGTIALTANKLSVFAATSSSELAGVISDEVGTGALMFGTSPRITTSILDTNGNTMLAFLPLAGPTPNSFLTIENSLDNAPTLRVDTTGGQTSLAISLVALGNAGVAISNSGMLNDQFMILPYSSGSTPHTGTITSGDLTSDVTWTFPTASITVNAAADISGTTLNSGVVTSSLTSVGVLTSLTTSGHVASTGPAAVDAAVVSCTSRTVTGTDTRGTILATCTAGQTVTVNFGAAYSPAPVCVVAPANATAATAVSTGVAYITPGTTSMLLTVLTSTTAGLWSYQCIQ